MKRWLPAALCAATLVWVVPAPVPAHGSPAPAGRSTSIPDVIILAKDHPTHATVFSSRLNKSSYWRAEIQRKGYDAAFDEWMKQDHPYEYANACVKEAKKLTVALKGTDQMAQFMALLPKRADLRAEVKSEGMDPAFADWLRREHPAVYVDHYKKIDPSMNDKQMPRGMPM
jgi:hypothetical protein